MYQELKSVQAAELYILKEIKRICEEEGIQYFLTGGTMLGAVRHQGFIPWDDDIDIAMVQEEYKKFIAIAPKKLGSEFFLDNEFTDSDYGLVFSKVRLLNTEFVELKGNRHAVHNELFVDVFPYINLADDSKQRKKNGFKLVLLTQLLKIKSGYKVWLGEGPKKALKFLPVRFICLFASKANIRKRINKIAYAYERSAFTCAHNGSKNGYIRWVIPRGVFDEYTFLNFEGEPFPVPKDFDQCLRTFYGSTYMELPPENKRITHRPVHINLGKYTEEEKVT